MFEGKSPLASRAGSTDSGPDNELRESYSSKPEHTITSGLLTNRPATSRLWHRK